MLLFLFVQLVGDLYAFLMLCHVSLTYSFQGNYSSLLTLVIRVLHGLFMVVITAIYVKYLVHMICML